MQKLKSALRRRRRSGSIDPSEDGQYSETSSPRTSHSEARAPRASLHAKRASEDTGRSRPLSSAYNPNRLSNSHVAAGGVAQPRTSQPNGVGYAQPNNSGPIGGALADDYKTYISAYPAENVPEVEKHMTSGGDRQLMAGESQGHREKDVADRNVGRYSTSMDAGARKPLPAIPVTSSHVVTGSAASHNLPINGNSAGLATSTAPAAKKHVVSRDVLTKQGPVDGILPHTEASDPHQRSSQSSDWPIQSARDETGAGLGREKLRALHRDDEDLPQPPAPLKIRQQQQQQQQHSGSAAKPVEFKAAIVDGQGESEAHRQLRLKGIMDLRNTVDTDADVHWAPAVEHTVLKPHQHEVIQRKVYREIHNYEVYHRIQPVIHTEVLPPRHWIPNPNGEGLLQISPEELPARTGNNRWWSIVQHDPTPATFERICTYERKWRTQPVVIEGKPSITAEGIERKETTILHPPTLADLSGYTGEVQTIHFDHKTGERWWGEITTLDKLKEQTDRPHHADQSLNLDGLEEALPSGSSEMPLRRKHMPVAGQAL